MAGKSPYLQAVQFDATDVAIGNVVTVEITHTGTNSLFGRLLGATAAPQRDRVGAL